MAEDFVALGGVAAARSDPGSHPVADTRRLDFRRDAFAGAGMVVALSVLAAAAATRAPFHPETERAEVRVIVDHTDGRPLVVDPESPLGGIDAVIVTANGASSEAPTTSWSGSDLGIIDVAVEADSGEIEVVVVVDGQERLVATAAAPSSGERLLVQLSDVPRPVVASDGERVFNARGSGCAVCHSVVEGDDGVGPSLGGIATVAGDRVRGLDAENYLRQSILLPDQYVVEGWPAGQMSPFYRDTLSEDDLTALLTYLLTLKGTDE